MAQAAIPIIGAVIGAAGSVGATLLAGKPKAAAAPIIPTANAAADAARNEDPLRKRRGVGANVLTGPGGAEPASAGTKVLLGQ